MRREHLARRHQHRQSPHCFYWSEWIANGFSVDERPHTKQLPRGEPNGSHTSNRLPNPLTRSGRFVLHENPFAYWRSKLGRAGARAVCDPGFRVRWKDRMVVKPGLSRLSVASKLQFAACLRLAAEARSRARKYLASGRSNSRGSFTRQNAYPTAIWTESSGPLYFGR